jgi:hypothetical protein
MCSSDVAEAAARAAGAGVTKASHASSTNATYTNGSVCGHMPSTAASAASGLAASGACATLASGACAALGALGADDDDALLGLGRPDGDLEARRGRIETDSRSLRRLLTPPGARLCTTYPISACPNQTILYKYTHIQTPLPLMQGTWATPASTKPTINNHESRTAQTPLTPARPRWRLAAAPCGRACGWCRLLEVRVFVTQKPPEPLQLAR